VKTINFLYLLVGIGILAYVFSETDLELLWSNLVATGWGIFFVIAIYGIAFGMDTVAWQYTLPSTRSNFKWLYDLWKVRMVGAAFGKVLPFSAFGGAPIKAYLLKKNYGISYRESAASIILVESTHLMSMVFFMTSGVMLIHFSPDFPENYYLFSKLSLAALAIGIFGFYFVQRLKVISIVGGWLSRQALGRRLGKFLLHLQEFDDRLVHFYIEKSAFFFGALGLNLLNWYMGALELYIILYFLGHPISIAESIILETLVELVRAGTFFIPATLGTQEAAFLLATVAITGEPTLGLATALMRRVREIVWFILGLAIGWQYSTSYSGLEQVAQNEITKDSS
jgi:glycosyltransferase 2 family protein